MSQNTRAQNSGQEGDLRRNNPPPYNLRPFQPQVKEQEGDEPPLMARRRTTRHQPRRETRIEHLEQRIDKLTELVNTLVTNLGQNAANVTHAIPPGILLANTGGEEDLPSQEGEDVAVGSSQADTDVWRRHARRRRRVRREDQGDALDLCASKHTRNSVFSKLERVRVDLNLDDGYDSENERSAGSKESTDLRARLNTRRVRPEQQAESRPPVRATPEEERLSQMQE